MLGGALYPDRSGEKTPRPGARAVRGSRAGATGPRPKLRSGCRVGGWRNRHRPRRRRPARQRPRREPDGSATSTENTAPHRGWRRAPQIFGSRDWCRRQTLADRNLLATPGVPTAGLQGSPSPTSSHARWARPSRPRRASVRRPRAARPPRSRPLSIPSAECFTKHSAPDTDVVPITPRNARRKNRGGAQNAGCGWIAPPAREGSMARSKVKSRRRLKIYLGWLAATVGLILAACFAVNCLVDPLWYLRGNVLTQINYPFNERLAAMIRFLPRLDDYDCVIFGTSRASLLPE